MVTRLLTEKLRAELKNPIGELLRGEEDRVKALLSERFRNAKPNVLVSVGDKVSETLIIIGLKPKLVIYDEKTKRTKNYLFKPSSDKFLTVENPAGMLTEEALKAVKEALEGEGFFGLKVKGEEDLLTLPAIFYSPEGAIVAYGQPDEGIVLVKVTWEKKKFAEKIIKMMEVIT